MPAAPRELLEARGNGRKTVLARAALARALLREIASDPRRLHDAAGAGGKRHDRTRAERRTDAGEARVRERNTVGVRCFDPRAEEAADEVALSRPLGARLLEQGCKRAPQLDLVHPGVAYRPGDRHERGARLVWSSGRTEPRRSESRDERKLCQRLDVQHDGGGAAHTALVGTRRREGG